jgi:hypothetical protein
VAQVTEEAKRSATALETQQELIAQKEKAIKMSVVDAGNAARLIAALQSELRDVRAVLESISIPDEAQCVLLDSYTSNRLPRTALQAARQQRHRSMYVHIWP